MSDVIIDVDIGGLNATLEKLANFQRTELLQIIAAKSEEQVKLRIEEEKTSPAGVPWAAWSDDYAKHRPSGTSLLVSKGYLHASVTGQVVGDEVMVSTNLPYAARQNESREFMGLSQENIDETKALVSAWFESYLNE